MKSNATNWNASCKYDTSVWFIRVLVRTYVVPLHEIQRNFSVFPILVQFLE